jgi:hypothetical protein
VVIVTVSLAMLGSTAATERPDVAVTVQRPAQATVIPRSFLGLSLEYRTVETYAGPDPSAPNPLFPRLVRALAPGQVPVLRIGGDSTDRTWWPTPGFAQPPGVNLTLDSHWLDVTRTLTKTLGARLILGLNLEAGSPSLAAAQANAFISGLGARSIRAFELGNEPDLYGRFAWYRTPGGAKVNGRPHDYDVAAFTQDFSNAAADLPAGIPLAGPGFGTLGWNRSLAPFLGAEPRVGLVTLHRYPLQHCFIKPQNPRSPTLANLLSPTASTGLADLFAPYVAIARAHHLPMRIDELNTVACGAVPSVSQTFASALWALDTLFEFARVGVAGVNMHTFAGAGYELFRFTHTSAGWRASVSPEYNGLLMFARATPAGSRLLTVGPATGPKLKLWATEAPDGIIRVVLINKGLTGLRIVGVRLPDRGAAAVLRLRAPGIGSVRDSLLSDGSVSATDGRYIVSVPAASAAMLTVPAAKS